MTANAILRPAALEDLDAIERFIQQDSPANAARFVDDLLERCAALAENPLIGVARPDLGAGLRLFGVRRRVAIIYRPDPEGAVILRILYGGRDLQALFRDEAE